MDNNINKDNFLKELEQLEILKSNTIGNSDCTYYTIDLDRTRDCDNLGYKLSPLMQIDNTKDIIDLNYYNAQKYMQVNKDFINYFGNNYLELIDHKDFHEFFVGKGYAFVQKEIARNLCAINNSKVLLKKYIHTLLAHYNPNSKIHSVEINGKEIDYSHKFIQQFLENNNIASAKWQMDGKVVNTPVVDKNWLMAQVSNSKKLKIADELYSPLIDELEDKYFAKKDLLKNLSDTPENVMEYIMNRCPKVANEYSRICPGFEGYTLGQHTENTIRFLHDNFSRQLPDKVVGMLNLILFMHDIGKPEVNAQHIHKGFAKEHDIYTAKARMVCSSLGINEKFADNIMNFYFGTQPITTQYYVFENESFLNALLGKCRNLTKEFGVDSEEYIVLSYIARILQTCDSGAYTSYCKTRDGQTGLYLKVGHYVFTDNFEKTINGYRFKEDAKDGSLDNPIIPTRAEITKE